MFWSLITSDDMIVMCDKHKIAIVRVECSTHIIGLCNVKCFPIKLFCMAHINHCNYLTNCTVLQCDNIIAAYVTQEFNGKTLSALCSKPTRFIVICDRACENRAYLHTHFGLIFE